MTYASTANDENARKANAKKPYNPRVGAKANSLLVFTKTNFIGSLIDFLKVEDLQALLPSVCVGMSWMIQKGKWIFSPIFVQARIHALLLLALLEHCAPTQLHLLHLHLPN